MAPSFNFPLHRKLYSTTTTHTNKGNYLVITHQFIAPLTPPQPTHTQQKKNNKKKKRTQIPVGYTLSIMITKHFMKLPFSRDTKWI